MNFDAAGQIRLIRFARPSLASMSARRLYGCRQPTAAAWDLHATRDEMYDLVRIFLLFWIDAFAMIRALQKRVLQTRPRRVPINRTAV